MNWFWKFLYCLVVVASGLMVSFFICMIALISFWWMLVIIPIDVLMIWQMIHQWRKEDAEVEKKERALWDSM